MSLTYTRPKDPDTSTTVIYLNDSCLIMAQVKAINTRTVNKVDGHSIFKMVKNMTGASDEEILTVITPDMVPMIGRNAASVGYYSRGPNLTKTWDIGQQISWGNALKWLKAWQKSAEKWPTVDEAATNIRNLTTPSIVQKVRGTPFPAITTLESQKLGREKMTTLLVQSHNWNVQGKAEKKYIKMSYTQLKKAFLTNPGTGYPLYNKNKSQREAMITQHITQNEGRRKTTFYQDLWTQSGGSSKTSVLMMMGLPHPNYYMAWIIAKTYQNNNQQVKNVSRHEGCYKYRNWELKERYYPFVGTGDTLPKTTAEWPRYSTSPSILNDFTMQEVAQALKSNFGGVLQAEKDVNKGLIQKAVDSNKQRRDNLLQNSQHTLQQILSQGLDVWNKSMLATHATYYDNRSGTRQLLPASKMVLIAYADVKNKLGPSKYSSVIKQYESKQKDIRDTTIKGAKDNYDKAMSNVNAAKGTHSVPKRSPPKIRSQ